MKVTFLKDMRLAVAGIHAKDFKKGDVAELPEAQAKDHIRQGNVALGFNPVQETKPIEPVEEAKESYAKMAEEKPKRTKKRKSK